MAVVALAAPLGGCAAAEATDAPAAAPAPEPVAPAPDTPPPPPPVQVSLEERWRAPFAVETRGTAAPRERRAAVVRVMPDTAAKVSARPPAPADTAPAAAPTTRPAARTHVVARGDTLFGIARKYGVSAEQIRRANRMESDVVKLGQTLVIPAGG